MQNSKWSACSPTAAAGAGVRIAAATGHRGIIVSTTTVDHHSLAACVAHVQSATASFSPTVSVAPRV